MFIKKRLCESGTNMFGSSTQCCLWGIWIFWAGSIIAFLLSRRIPLLIFISSMGCFILMLLISGWYAKGKKEKMFNFGKKEDALARDIDVLPAEPAEQISAAGVKEKDSVRETTISPGTCLRGEITNENNITVSGEVIGDVVSKKIIHIGKEGNVSGKVTALKLNVNGLLKGSCYARTVTIMSRGRIEGDVYASEFSIEKGGIFIGHSHWVEDDAEIKQQKINLVNPAERSPHLVSQKTTDAIAIAVPVADKK